jgi:hypothetical protein
VCGVTLGILYMSVTVPSLTQGVPILWTASTVNGPKYQSVPYLEACSALINTRCPCMRYVYGRCFEFLRALLVFIVCCLLCNVPPPIG